MKDPEQEDAGGWIPAKVECDLCRHQWIAVYHQSCQRLECPNCENLALFEVVEYCKTE